LDNIIKQVAQKKNANKMLMYKGSQHLKKHEMESKILLNYTGWIEILIFITQCKKILQQAKEF
jgi:hypothetical protein